MKTKLLVLILTFAISVYSRVADFYLRDMVNLADVIVLATVNKVQEETHGKRATAIVNVCLKGNSSDTVYFQANPTWTCDISDAKEGESAIYFLTKPVNRRGFRQIVISGRGRIPLKFAGEDTLVNFQISAIYPWDLVSQAKIDTMRTQNSFSYVVRSISLNLFKTKVMEQLKTKYDFVPKRFIPPPDYVIHNFIEKNGIKNSVDLQTIFDGIPRIGNDKAILVFLFGTIDLTDINSIKFNKRLGKLFPGYEFAFESSKLTKIENKN
jgi:hypothetical protein